MLHKWMENMQVDGDYFVSLYSGANKHLYCWKVSCNGHYQLCHPQE